MSELYLGDQLITPVVMETVVKDDFNELKNKPQVNDVELVGNKTLDELGIQAKGDYALREEIPSIEGLATEQQLTQGLDTKQDKGDYALVEDIPTLVSELENDKNYATQTQVMQAIASIPQFKLSIVEALPETGEKMTLYLVSKGGESPDVYDEYIWIEQTNSYEFLGTTAVDLTDYVKKTDYAGNTGGVIKSSVAYSTRINDGFLTAVSETLDNYNVRPNTSFISKGTLENIKDDYVKRGLTENSIEFTDEEKTSARTLIGAVGNTDYAGNNKVGLISAQYGYGLSATSSGHLYCNVRTLEDYNGSLVNSAFISKGTLNNVLTQYSKTVSITQADYDSLETKDANTLYLIEES